MTHLDLYKHECERFLLALELETGIYAACTDLSRLDDFPLDDVQVAGISERLGVPVSGSDYVLDVCKRLGARKAVN
jgi:hypothetical protein